jgi:lipoprotein-anchoring transpeptidase ErfK/SrfK
MVRPRRRTRCEMRQRSFILVAAFVFLLIAGAIAAYAYDSSRDDLIAKGVRVAGVDVGGLRAAEARERLTREVSQPLEQPIVVRRKDKRFSLSAEDARVRADVAGMVDEALAATRDGNILTRVARDLTGGEENVRLPAQVSYSDQAVTRLVRRVKKGINRPAQDARVSFPAVAPVKEKKGLEVKGGSLRQRIEQALRVPAADRTVKVPVKVLHPKVTQEQLADKYPLVLVVERPSFQLKLYRRLKLQRTYTVAIGQVGYDTPAGLYHIQNKAVNPAWSVPNSDWAGDLAGTVVPGGTPQNPLKARWLGIYDGAGIHGTDAVGSLGTAASHGCIRMSIPEVIELYDQVPVGAPIYIA